MHSCPCAHCLAAGQVAKLPLSLSGRLPSWASPFLRRLANASGRIEFIIFLIMDWSFASGCSPPRPSATQLPSATDSQCSVRWGLSPHCWCALSGAHSGGALRADWEQGLVFVLEEDSHGKAALRHIMGQKIGLVLEGENTLPVVLHADDDPAIFLCLVVFASALNSSTDMPVRVAARIFKRSLIGSFAIASRLPESTVLNGSTFLSSGFFSTSASTRSRQYITCVYIGCSTQSVPSWSKVAMRSSGATYLGSDLSVTSLTNAKMACLAGPSFHDGSGSWAWARVWLARATASRVNMMRIDFMIWLWCVAPIKVFGFAGEFASRLV